MSKDLTFKYDLVIVFFFFVSIHQVVWKMFTIGKSLFTAQYNSERSYAWNCSGFVSRIIVCVVTFPERFYYRRHSSYSKRNWKKRGKKKLSKHFLARQKSEGEKSECKALKFRAGPEEHGVEFKLCLSLYDHQPYITYCIVAADFSPPRAIFADISPVPVQLNGVSNARAVGKLRTKEPGGKARYV